LVSETGKATGSELDAILFLLPDIESLETLGESIPQDGITMEVPSLSILPLNGSDENVDDEEVDA